VAEDAAVHIGERHASGAEIVIVADAKALAAEAARRTRAALAAAIEARGVAHIALTGGSTAVLLYVELAAPENHGAVDWSRVHLWWGDERFVPIDHPESNAGLAYRLLLNLPARAGESGDGAQGADVTAGAVPGLPINPEHVHPVEVEETLSDSEPVDLAAQLYAEDLDRHVPSARGGVPRLDVLLSGLGPDGHIMSIFPGSPALAADAPIVLAIPAPDHVDPKLPRVTLSARVLPATESVLVMASGEAKAEVVASVLGGKADPDRWPAQSALLPNATWLLDQAAAAQWMKSR
jgi:6-phosphogluconolactonase